MHQKLIFLEELVNALDRRSNTQEVELIESSCKENSVEDIVQKVNNKRVEQKVHSKIVDPDQDSRFDVEEVDLIESSFKENSENMNHPQEGLSEDKQNRAALVDALLVREILRSVEQYFATI